MSLRSQLVHLTASQKERSGDKLFRAIALDGVRFGIPVLAPKDLALRAEALD
jgi:acyl dehydratase